MKRLVALLLVIVIFSVIAMCFLRPIDENPDFGNVPKLAGYGCWEEITDCTGDTDLLTIDAIDWSRSTDGTIVVQTTPIGTMSFTSQVLDRDSYFVGAADERGRCGYAEKRIGNKWEYVGEIGVYRIIGNSQMGWRKTPDAWISYVTNTETEWYYRELKVFLPEYESGATYRINYFFRSFARESWSDEVHIVSHTLSLPQQSDKRLDFISLGWSDYGNKSFAPEIRVNYGEAPYLLLDACTLEQKENGHWVRSLDDEGEPAFWTHGDEPTQALKPCYNLPNHYYLPQSYWHLAFERQPSLDYRLTLVFCDNADGSGKRYTLTLYLNTELLAEYR